MRKLLIATSICLALAGCASNSDVNQLKNQLKTTGDQTQNFESRIQKLEAENNNTDNKKYCFWGTQRFSEGASYQGKTCTRATGVIVVKNGEQVVYPLVWQFTAPLQRR